MFKVQLMEMETLLDIHDQLCVTGKMALTLLSSNPYFLTNHSDFEGMMPARYLRHGAQPEEEPVIKESPMLQPFWAAGFSFSRGHFKVQVPYDAYQPMVFQVI
jgi:hypothetical protein